MLNLIAARDAGFNIPASYVETNKSRTSKILNDKTARFITKPLNNGHLHIDLKNKIWSSAGTVEIDGNSLSNLTEVFSPSLIQRYVEKQFEVRVFYFVDFLYSVAIFSQNDERTRIDFRNYNLESFNRVEPIELPMDVQSKIRTFMKKVDLQTGSIDLIYNSEFDYTFLEVNPSGQFSWISKLCNLNIEEEISDKLISMHNENQ